MRHRRRAGAYDGRPDVVVAVTGSGIQWDDAELAAKAVLNAGELGTKAAPQKAAGEACADLDCNGDHLFTVADYAADARVNDRKRERHQGPRRPSSSPSPTASTTTRTVHGRHLRLGLSSATTMTPPTTDASATERASTQRDDRLPRLPLPPAPHRRRLGREANDLAEALLYAADAKARVAAAGVFTVDQTAFAKTAIDYAYRKNMLIVAAIGDTASRAHSMPATANHVLTTGGVRYDGDDPAKATTFLQLDGCSSYGPSLSVMGARPVARATAAARIAGIAGLVFSAAADAKVDVSAEEAIQLFRSQADAIGSAGFNVHAGYGRANAARMVDAVLAKRVRPRSTSSRRSGSRRSSRPTRPIRPRRRARSASSDASPRATPPSTTSRCSSRRARSRPRPTSATSSRSASAFPAGP